MRRLAEEGYAVVFVSHYLEEVFEVADKVTVLRDGRVAFHAQMDGVTQEHLVEAMLGRTVTEFYPRRSGVAGKEPYVCLDGAECPGLDPMDLEVRAGEILGVAGLVGSGAASLGEMLGGLRPPRNGTISIHGRQARLRTPADALAAGIAYVPEDRRSDALLQDLSIATNMTLPLAGAPHSPLVGVGGLLRRKAERVLVENAIEHMGVKATDPALPINVLSGGNQQKVVLGRWFLRDVPCLVLNNPTKGIDVGSKEEVYRYINGLADSGHAVIFISSYNAELLGLSDRLVALFQGKVVGMFDRHAVTEQQLIDLTMSGLDSGDTTVVSASGTTKKGES
jgi:ABC-type sugar transport system ATPase subunit